MKSKSYSQLMSRLSLGLLALVALTQSAPAQQPDAAQHLAKLKAHLVASEKALKQYEWMETIAISLKGEEKSREMNRCYYGADGGIQKVPVTTPPPEEKRRGLRGRIEEKKKEELTDTMKSAVALVKTYVPPKPEKLQATKDTGKLSVDMLDPGKRIQMNFKDYEKAGDVLSVEVDLATNRPLAIKVKTHLDQASDVVTLDVQMGQLMDGTTYPSHIALSVAAEQLEVDVTNSGYEKTK